MKLAVISAYTQHNFYLHWWFCLAQKPEEKKVEWSTASAAGHWHGFGDLVKRGEKATQLMELLLLLPLGLNCYFLLGAPVYLKESEKTQASSSNNEQWWAWNTCGQCSGEKGKTWHAPCPMPADCTLGMQWWAEGFRTAGYSRALINQQEKATPRTINLFHKMAILSLE